MSYEQQLDLLQTILKKIRLQSVIISSNDNISENIDISLRPLFQKENEYANKIRKIFFDIKGNTIYKYTNTYLFKYIFFLLPETSNKVFIIGPFLSTELNRETLMELAEKLGITPKDLNSFENYYASVPIINEDSHIFAVIDSFAEIMWGKEKNYNVIDINREDEIVSPTFYTDNDGTQSAIWAMEMMEKRYKYENELMDAVSSGHTQKAELLISNFSSLSFEQRLANPLRNLKNYCIIMNTLLRKAAEKGGVHPIYIDATSSSFAKEIEQISSTSNIPTIMGKMFKTYCRLVKKHSIKNYSSPVQKAITCIDADLTTDLSLSKLSSMQNISSAYLSNIFKKETGQTVTEYVTVKRIEMAKRLLSNTNLQIQTVAQHCGILDVHYFSKLFKKHTGLTPKDYRKL